jgi:hypothetical protein
MLYLAIVKYSLGSSSQEMKMFDSSIKGLGWGELMALRGHKAVILDLSLIPVFLFTGNILEHAYVH